LALPVRPEYFKSIADLTKKLDTKPPQTKWESFKTFVLEDEDDVLSCVRFQGFKNETYRLEKDSFIRIRLKIAPTNQEQQSQISASLPTSKVTATKSESHGLHWTSEPMERQEKKSTLPEVHHVDETTRVINASVTMEGNQGNCEDRYCVEESFRKVVAQVGEGVNNPSINSPYAYPTVNATDNKENITNGVAIPIKPVDKGVVEKAVSQKSKKVWFQRTKTTKIRDAEVSSGSQPMLDKKSDIKSNADGAAAADLESRELENDQTQRVMYSSSGVVDAEPSLVEMACPENTTNDVAPLDSTDKIYLPRFDKKFIDAPDSDHDTKFDGSEDSQPQRHVSEKSSSKKPGKAKSLQNNKSWFKKTSKASKREHSLSLFSGSFKDTDASDPFLEVSPSSSNDVQTLVGQEMASDNFNIRKESSDPLAEDFLKNNSADITRSLVTASLKSKNLRYRAISSEFTEDGLQVVNGGKKLYPSMSYEADNLSLPAAAAAETSVSVNENSLSLQSNVAFVESRHAESVKIGESEILQGTKCIERDLSQFVSEHEVEVTPEDFLKAAELTTVQSAEEFALAVRSNSSFSNRDICLIEKHEDHEQIDGSVCSIKDIVDDSYDLSQCHCEDCKSKSLKSPCQEGEELCESIELELKKKASKSVLGISKDRHEKRKKTSMLEKNFHP
jgi:hypothetical protein